uniref:Ribonuclease VapC n=1 Tax=Geoglobus ahangari TaxID=113653 RepID=A0A7C3UD83_9EURY
MDVFLDTSFIVSLIIKTEKTERARRFFTGTGLDFAASVAVYEESLYTGLRIIAEKRLGIKNAYKLRDFVRKNGYEFAADFMSALHETFDEIRVLRDAGDIDSIKATMERFKLLPNDALIAATCKHYGIKKIATFDEDFKRIDFLEVVEI